MISVGAVVDHRIRQATRATKANLRRKDWTQEAVILCPQI